MLRRILTTTFSAACLLTACSGEDGGNSDAPGRVTGATSVERDWTAAISSFNEAFNDYATFYRDVYLSPLPDEVQTDEETIAYITDIHQDLVDVLAVVADFHEVLGPALEDAISQGVISSEEVSDFREFDELTGRWTTIQERYAQDSLDCLERNPDDLERIQVCLQGLIQAPKPLLDELADQIRELGRRLFGTAWIAP